jgi:large subunit ribosomal protein L4
MTLPVFKFSSNEYTGDNVILDHDIFNQILRQDIVHRVMNFNKEYNRKTFKWVRSKGDVSGSNRKPFQQKKTGRAPQGDIRAPNLYHGGRAHGARPRTFYYPLNKKVRLLGLKIMLTSKFLENKIIVVDSDDTEGRKLENCFSFLREQKSIFMTKSKDAGKYEESGLDYLIHLTPDKVNVMHLISSSYLIITLEGLNELLETLSNRQANYFRNKKLPFDLNKKYISPLEKYNFDFDPNAKLKIYTPILKGSYEEIANHYKDPSVLINAINDRKQKELDAKIAKKEEDKKKLQESLYDDDAVLNKRRILAKKEKKMKLLKEQNKKKLAARKAAVKVAK